MVSMTDVSRQAFGKYQYCTKFGDEWYSDDDLHSGRVKPGALPKPEPKHKWPFCEPDRPGSRPLGMTANNLLYKKMETSPGVWQWVRDHDQERRISETPPL